MARLPPNKPSRRRDQDKRASTSQGKTPQITDPAAGDGNSSTDTSLNQEPLDASTPDEASRVSPSGSQLFETPRTTATENQRRSSFLSLLPLRSATDEDPGDGQVTNGSDIDTQLKEFFKRQEEFNRKIEQQVQLALKETADKTRQSKRLPKELSSNVRAVYDRSDKKWDLSKKSHESAL